MLVTNEYLPSLIQINELRTFIIRLSISEMRLKLLTVRKFILFFTLCLVQIVAQGQSQQFKYRVIVPKYIHYPPSNDVANDTLFVIRESLSTRSETLDSGTIITREGEFSENGTKYKFTSSDTLDNPRQITVNYRKKAILKDGHGFATLSINDTNKSKIQINYWLSEKFDRNDNYSITLLNRGTAKFWFHTLEGGALTIPFKFRPSFEKNGVVVEQQFRADLNVGVYLGYTFGQVKYMFRKQESTKPTEWKVSFGPLLSISTTKINSFNTSASDNPLSFEVDIATFSPGIGLMTSVSNFRFGVFYGYDFAFGETAEKWNYNNKSWFGFGVGYNLGLLWGKAE